MNGKINDQQKRDDQTIEEQTSEDRHTAIHMPLWNVFEQISVSYVLIFWHLTWMGKWFEDFQVHRSFFNLKSLVLSWVRHVVGNDCVEILRVVF